MTEQLAAINEPIVGYLAEAEWPYGLQLYVFADGIPQTMFAAGLQRSVEDATLYLAVQHARIAKDKNNTPPPDCLGAMVGLIELDAMRFYGAKFDPYQVSEKRLREMWPSVVRGMTEIKRVCEMEGAK